MQTTRLSLLFTESRFPSAYVRHLHKHVLTACCEAAGEQSARNRKGNYPTSLTDQTNGFSIDQVVERIWKGVSGHRYALHEIVHALQTLASHGYLELYTKDYSLIILTDTLFKSIAEAWAYALGVRAFVFGDQTIYAQSEPRANVIRLERELKVLFA